MTPLGELLRALLLLVTISGSLYAVSNWRSARSDRHALTESQSSNDVILRTVAQGSVDDQLRVALAQIFLLGAAATILFSPPARRDPSLVVDPSFVVAILLYSFLLACSIILAYKSHKQHQRRNELFAIFNARAAVALDARHKQDG